MYEDFVPFELAKKLKEKGFDESCYQKYDDEGYLSFNHAGYINDEKPCDDFCALAPTISQVLKWLREEKKIYLEIVIVSNAEYMCDIYKINPRPVKCLGSTEYFKTYEATALAGIEYTINNLI